MRVHQVESLKHMQNPSKELRHDYSKGDDFLPGKWADR
jgi:hypothetical protein